MLPFSNAPAALGIVVALFQLCASSDIEIISDLTTSAGDERRALELKAEQFWRPVLQAAEETKMDEHLTVYSEVEAAIGGLPAENSHVKDLLTEALTKLKQADEKLMLQNVQTAELASEKLTEGPAGEAGSFSFLSGGQNFLSQAIQRFVGVTSLGGSARYSQRLLKHIQRRQDDIVPALRGASTMAGDILTNCRLASKLSFDVLKYDIYTKGAPKTPEPVKKVAYKLVDAAGETRHRFMQGVMSAVGSITRDTQERHSNPSATVTQSLLAGLPQDLQPFGQGSSHDAGKGFIVNL
eukprot:TRINITY_DN111948_c0_g1_i1.p1 TRINITY_DN111948_c0_g1~~TRINITY_DN111948_c0_g1_i1.p1  ORF type:complete len:296 (+),score=84.64 TRINITY_DN111948_c0_g1_i1:60-947(+)